MIGPLAWHGCLNVCDFVQCTFGRESEMSLFWVYMDSVSIVSHVIIVESHGGQF